jgi:hypothetical protein
MTGRAVCYHHGGRSLSGASSGTFRHGRYSKDLPTRLAARYEEARTDAELLSLREDVAVIDARLADLMANLDRGEAGRLWVALGVALADLERARRSNDARGVAEALTTMGDLIRQGASEAQRWGEIYEAEKLRLALVDGERKRLADMEAMITASQATVFAVAVKTVFERAVRELIHDADLQRQLLGATSAGVAALVGADGEPRVVARRDR